MNTRLTLGYIGIGIVFIMTLFVIILLIDVFTLKYMGTKQVGCYDGNANLILNQTCSKDVFCGVIARNNFVPYCKSKFPLMNYSQEGEKYLEKLK